MKGHKEGDQISFSYNGKPFTIVLQQSIASSNKPTTFENALSTVELEARKSLLQIGGFEADNYDEETSLNVLLKDASYFTLEDQISNTGVATSALSCRKMSREDWKGIIPYLNRDIPASTILPFLLQPPMSLEKGQKIEIHCSLNVIDLDRNSLRIVVLDDMLLILAELDSDRGQLEIEGHKIDGLNSKYKARKDVFQWNGYCLKPETIKVAFNDRGLLKFTISTEKKEIQMDQNAK